MDVPAGIRLTGLLRTAVPLVILVVDKATTAPGQIQYPFHYPLDTII
jgi:hypothetical protein